MRTDTEIAIDVLDAMTTPHRIDDFLAYLSDDATWTIPGDWPRISGVLTRPGLDTFAKVIMPAGFPSGAQLQVVRVADVGESVYVEATVTATTSKDRDYQNSYCFVLDLAEGKVTAIREYMDTLYADRVLHQ